MLFSKLTEINLGQGLLCDYDDSGVDLDSYIYIYRNKLPLAMVISIFERYFPKICLAAYQSKLFSEVVDHRTD